MSDVSTQTARVDVKSAWASKINWTQAMGIGASALVVVTGGKIDIPPEVQLALVGLIQSGQAITTWVIKTWFTTTVTPASVK
jgi:hypothetical protein